MTYLFIQNSPLFDSFHSFFGRSFHFIFHSCVICKAGKNQRQISFTQETKFYQEMENTILSSCHIPWFHKTIET